MEKKYLKKVLSGLSVASLVAGITGAALAAGGWSAKKVTPAPSGWSGSKEGAVSTQEVVKETPAPDSDEAAKEVAPGYGEKKDAAPGYGGDEKEDAPGYGK